MKVKGLKFIELVNSQGFLIPVQYTKQRMEAGLEAGKFYDLDIQEVSGGGNGTGTNTEE